MQFIGEQLVLSASDLTGFLSCGHLTRLELLVAKGQLTRAKREAPEVELIARHGDEHERRYLAKLEAEGLSVVRIERPSPARGIEGLLASEAKTTEAMSAGADAIYQATFFDGRFRGHADFLLKVDRPCAKWKWSYEVYDTKLSRAVKAVELVQLCSYSEQLERVQAMAPEQVHVVAGDQVVHSFRVADFAAYFRHAKARLLETVTAESPEALYPDPVSHCEVCGWAEVCQERRRKDDHLSLVANIRGDQTKKLVQGGVDTVAKLGNLKPGSKVKGIGAPTVERLRHQATLQVRGRTAPEMLYELLEEGIGPQRGLSLLPPPSAGDLFFDMEGDPFAQDGEGLEYLFGVTEIAEGKPNFRGFWAHSRAEEKKGFEDFVDFVRERQRAKPELHVYHYAPYEPSALRRLMGLHGTREKEIDDFLRQGVLVDLYQVVRQAVRASADSYSIKALEPLYLGRAREGEVKTAASSIVVYEEYLETGEQKLLEAIRAYNEEDCFSTLKLRDWLEARRVEAKKLFGREPERPRPREAASEKQEVLEAQVAAIVAALMVGVPAERTTSTPEQRARALLADLLSWHRREAKPEWWAYFERLTKTPEELVDDAEAIGGLAHEKEVGPGVGRYRFDPAQEFKLFEEDVPHDPATESRAGEILALDRAGGLLELKRRAGAPHPAALIPMNFVPDTVLRAAVQRLAGWVVGNGLDGDGPFRSGLDLLLRRPPRVAAHAAGAPLQGATESGAEAALRLVSGLQETCMAIQGPPGTGKTHTGAQMVLKLVAAGKRVGVTALSHKAISNFLGEVARQATKSGQRLRILQKAAEAERCPDAMVQATNDNKAVARKLSNREVDLVGGTPWLFARPELAGEFDVLFVDEAGQMSLANTLAVCGAAKSLVLLGDPQQLAQPSKGSHPPGAEVSALEHLLEGRATVPPGMGLFLESTYRMHPGVCGFVSDAFYEGRLRAADSCSAQVLAGAAGLPASGLAFVPVPHEGNRSSADEEASVVAALVKLLVGARWTDAKGTARALTLNDVLVVAPYNNQVARLVLALPAAARVGTVDKFQGQEAPVSIYSMATSSAEEVPRTMEFLYEHNRLNVAVSRARTLAILVCSPKLLEASCRTPKQMALVNALCWFAERAAAVP